MRVPSRKALKELAERYRKNLNETLPKQGGDEWVAKWIEIYHQYHNK